ncbi:MAG: TRCF domain-containing protein [Verrucomicrobiales bacterium]
MRDLEIRGAGNLLGTKQSGHIAAVGFDLYCQLLRQSIDQLKGKQRQPRPDTSLKADFLVFSEARWDPAEEGAKLPAFLPKDYAPHGELRVGAYRRLAALQTQKELRQLEKNWRDRFGRPPLPVRTLLLTVRLRLVASHKLVQSIEIKKGRLILHRNGAPLLPADGKYPRLKSQKPLAQLEETLKHLENL